MTFVTLEGELKWTVEFRNRGKISFNGVRGGSALSCGICSFAPAFWACAAQLVCRAGTECVY